MADASYMYLGIERGMALAKDAAGWAAIDSPRRTIRLPCEFIAIPTCTTIAYAP